MTKILNIAVDAMGGEGSPKKTIDGIIHHSKNLGVGFASKSGFYAAIKDNCDAVVKIDADGQHETNDIPKILQPILDGDADFVIGSRFVDGGGSEDMPAYRRLGIKVITAASNLSSDLGIQDTQSGFRAFSKLAIDRLRFDSEGMELSLEMLEDAHEKELKIKEVPTLIRYDVPKGSSFTALSHGFTVLAWAMLSLSQKKPLLVLGIPGFGLFATGAAMGLNAVNGLSDSVDYLVGPGLTAVWIGVLGLAMMATGLVLQAARNFLRHLLIREFGLA